MTNPLSTPKNGMSATPKNFADANQSWPWITEVLKPLGFTVIAVEFKLDWSYYWPELGPSIGRALEAADLGHFDGDHFAPLGETSHLFWYASTKSLANALQVVKREIESRGVLDQVKIGFADVETGLWRTFHPGLINS